MHIMQNYMRNLCRTYAEFMRNFCRTYAELVCSFAVKW